MKGLVVREAGMLKLVHDIPEPVMGPYEALVEVDACGICNGTDLKMIDGHFKGQNPFPFVLGHESCGRVVQVGEKVKKFKVGDRVIRAKLRNTPQYYTGYGAFSELALVADYQAMVADGMTNVLPNHLAEQVVPASIDPAKALMIITLKEVYSALKRFGVTKDSSVVVNGCGPVGQTMVKFCKVIGVKNLIATDIDDVRLAAGKKMGADIPVNPNKTPLANVVRETFPEGVDIFLDAVGNNQLINQGLDLVKFNGKVAVYGISPQYKAMIDWERAPYNWVLQFIQLPTFQEEAAVHDEVVNMVLDSSIDLDDFVSHVMPVEDYERGFDLVRGRHGLKVSLTMR